MASASPYHVLLVCLVLALPTIQGLHYNVINNARSNRGGRIFEQIMGVERVKSSMQAATYFIWHRVFCQENISDRKQVERISLIIQSTLTVDAYYQEQSDGNHYFVDIYLNARIIERIVPESFEFDRSVESIGMEDRVIFEINWRLTVGVAYALQWTANGAIPEALRKGIAFFSVLEAHHKPAGWVNAGEGNQWDESPEVTAQFFYYISRKRYQFVAKLNEKMRTSYDERFFKEIAGMTMDEFWKVYKEDNHPA